MADFREHNKDYGKEMHARWEMKWEENDRGGHLWMGLFLLGVGVVVLLKKMMVPMPVWLYSWQMLLIAFGFFRALRHRFRPGGWLLLVLVGGFFLADEYFYPGQLQYHFWPAVLILLGLLFIVRSRKKYRRVQWEKKTIVEDLNNAGGPDDSGTFKVRKKYKKRVDILSIFSYTKKKVLSKEFKGGDVISFFGGTELDLTQADFNGKAKLDVTAFFGGVKLIIPPHWTIKSDVESLLGSIEDKRSVVVSTEDPGKVLYLDGLVFLGGIEINSY